MLFFKQHLGPTKKKTVCLLVLLSLWWCACCPCPRSLCACRHHGSCTSAKSRRRVRRILRACRMLQELHACCPSCQIRLCAEHYLTGCPHGLHGAAGAEESKPVSKGLRQGGWLRCQHPFCQTSHRSLKTCTGFKSGFGHRQCDEVRVCAACRRIPLPRPCVSHAKCPSPSSSRSQSSRISSFDASSLKAWSSDSFESLVAEYQHTAEHPARFPDERWHLALRVARLVEQDGCSQTEGEQRLLSLRLPRQKISEASSLWGACSTEAEKVKLAQEVPSTRCMGRRKDGILSKKQKHDLLIWCRLRAEANQAPSPKEVMGKMLHLVLISKGEASPTHLSGIALEAMQRRYNIANVYRGWRKWVAASIEDPLQRLVSASSARCLRATEAKCLTWFSVRHCQSRLRELMIKRDIATLDKDGELHIHAPERLWCCDEKGFNDDSMAAAAALTPAGVKATVPNRRRCDISQCFLVSVLLDWPALPAVMLCGKQWHPEWCTLWPESVTDFSERASFTAESFVKLLADPFIKHIRVTLALQGWVLLMLDSGGGREGMHLTMEFCLLMFHNEVEVFNLPEYHTRALMPLDREPHRRMELEWSHQRRLAKKP